MDLKKIASLFFLLILVFTSQANAALVDLSGNKVSLSSLKGNWVFINYWASWCHPCVEEIPELNQFYHRFKNDNVKVFGVNYDGLSISKQKHLIKELGIDYPSLEGDPAKTLSLGDIRGVPVTFILNPQGKLHKTLYGPQTMVSLRRAVR